jgi:hypothetical protein
MIVDEKNMIRIWAEEKVLRREMTPAEADKFIKDTGSNVKNYLPLAKDTAGSLKLVYKIARDFATWKGAKVAFETSSAGHVLVIFKGWPRGRKLITGTRYRVDHPKMIELQIGKPGIRAAAKDSARFGLWLVVVADVADYIMRDNATLGSLLGALTVDIPGVMLASAIGAAAGSMTAGATTGVLAVVGSFALGPLLVAFVVGAVVGLTLMAIDNRYGLTDKLAKAYDEGLVKLARLWDELGDAAEARYHQLANSTLVHDLERNIDWLSARVGRQADRVIGKLRQLW